MLKEKLLAASQDHKTQLYALFYRFFIQFCLFCIFNKLRHGFHKYRKTIVLQKSLQSSQVPVFNIGNTINQ